MNSLGHMEPQFQPHWAPKGLFGPKSFSFVTTFWAEFYIGWNIGMWGVHTPRYRLPKGPKMVFGVGGAKRKAFFLKQILLGHTNPMTMEFSWTNCESYLN